MISGHGFGVVDALADPVSVIATAVLFPYPPSHAWISMVLVRSDWQRLGLATMLMDKCIDLAAQLKLTPLLDATPAGKQVYEKLGFGSCFTISRFVLDRRGGIDSASGLEPVTNASRVEDTLSISPIFLSEVNEVAHEDAVVFGTDRKPVISFLLQQFPDLAKKVIAGKDEVVGYVLGREGRSARHIGPLVANSESVALALIDTIVKDVPETAEGRVVLLDVPDVHASFQETLLSRGFNRKRRFTRMQYGDCQPFGNYDKIFAIGGPEIG